MEGLIPMVFKAIKRNNTRRHYRCLSTGVAQSYDELLYDDHVNNDDGRRHSVDDRGNPLETRGGYAGGGKGHRRFGSTGDFEMRSDGYNNNFNYTSYEENGVVGRYPSSPPKELKRYRSHRIFSCISGEA